MRDLLRRLRRRLDFFYAPRLRWPMPEELYPDRSPRHYNCRCDVSNMEPGDVVIGDPAGNRVRFAGKMSAGKDEVRGA